MFVNRVAELSPLENNMQPKALRIQYFAEGLPLIIMVQGCGSMVRVRAGQLPIGPCIKDSRRHSTMYLGNSSRCHPSARNSIAEIGSHQSLGQG